MMFSSPNSPLSSPRRRGPIRRVLSMVLHRCDIDSAVIMGPRLRGDDRRRGPMRQIALGVFGMLAALAVAPAAAQDNYPSRVVRIVVPFPPGSGTDLLSRLVSDQLARKWNASVITENVPGA